MTPRPQLPDVGALVLGVLVAMGWAGAAGAAPPKEPPKKLTALIVAFDRYESLSRLQYPVKSALALALELQRIKYSVTFLTDAESVDPTRKALGDGATVEEVTTGDGLQERVFKWLDAEAGGDTAQLALLVMAGHGVERDGKPWFLAARDKLGEGGVSVQLVNEKAAEKRAPLVVIVDACRTPPDGAAPPAPAAPANPKGGSSDPIDQRQGSAVTVSVPTRGPLGKTGFRHPTNLFSTIPGKPAEDMHSDLIASLAKGLQSGERSRFQAHATGVVAKADDEATLSLNAWFYYGVTEVLRSTKLQQSHELRVGWPDLGTVVAQVDKGGKPVLPSLNAQRSVDLLGLWRPEHGDYLPTPLTPAGFGWQLAVPQAGAREPWSSGYVAPTEAGFDTTNKALFIEFVLEVANAPKGALAPLPFGIDGKHVNPPFPDRLLLANGRKYVCSAVPNKLTLHKAPLLPNQSINYIGFSDLPNGVAGGCVLKVRRLYLADASLSEAAEMTSPVDLLPRFWIGDTGQEADDALAFGVIQGADKAAAILKIGAGKGWRGGALAPPPGHAKATSWRSRSRTAPRRWPRCRSSSRRTSRISSRRGTAASPCLRASASSRSLSLKTAWRITFVVSKPSADVYLHSVRIRPGAR